MQLRSRTAGFVRTEGGLLPADLLERVRALDRKLPGIDGASYGLAKSERFGEAIARSWNRLTGAWAMFSDELAKLPTPDPATTTTRERFLLPLFDELGYGRLSPAKAIELEAKSYPVSHAYETVPLHLVGANVPLDRRSKGVAGAAGQSPHGLLQELLNRSPERLWGIVSNGHTLRILRDNASLVRQAYVEFDLEAIFTAEAYANFALLWHIAHRTRLEPRIADGADEGGAPSQAGCYLERWSKVAEETGARARDRLRDGVQEAIEALGSGFLAQPANSALRDQLVAGELATQDYYRELLRLVYRLILLFVAEDRDLLLDPQAAPEIRERYARYYSTARLRQLAERRKGSRHVDLYAGLLVVIGALGNDEGAPAIGLPPLGGFLFGPDACPHLDHAELANSDLLDAVRKLTAIEERGILRTVDYRNLGSEELGSIYESLLELHPEIDTAAGHFKLRTAAGHERKTTGSYYTPSSLISVLLDSALDPVLAEAADKPTKEEAEKAILALSVVDPAAGSGHFLVAAAHRIAKRLAQVRTDDEEPAPSAITTALRDVIGHCLYAVDINPMAVELCKVSLWLEALEPGKPLTFLDHHIKCGNSLLGTTPELVAQGIPDAAYDPIEGDDKAVARALKARNKAEREGQLSLGEAGLDAAIGPLAFELAAIDALADDAIAGAEAKEDRFRSFVTSTGYRQAKLAADAWCAAFVTRKAADAPEITTSTLRQITRDPEALPQRTRGAIEQLVAQYSVFQWQIEFPDVFRPPARSNMVTTNGGFDVVIGNPPWDQIQLDPQEWFAERAPSVANEPHMAARNAAIGRLRASDPQLSQAFSEATRLNEGTQHLIHKSGRYPLTSRGRLNSAPLFAEAMRSLVGTRGRVGAIVPTGIATDSFTQYFFADLVDSGSLVSLFDFENRWGIFPEVHRSYKFCLLTLRAALKDAAPAEFVFFAQDVIDLADPERRFTLTPGEFVLLNPNTRTCPVFRSRRDAELNKAIYRRVPILVDEARGPDGNPWAFQGLLMFMMNTASHMFRTEGQLTQAGWRLDGTIFSRGTERYLPLYEGKMVHQFDHRFGSYEGQTREQANQGKLPELNDAQHADPVVPSLPQYWVPEKEVESRLTGRWDRNWLIGWRDITSAVVLRTVIAAVIPRVAAGNKFPLIVARAPDPWPIVAVLNSLALDYAARQKVGGTTLNFYIIEQLPVLPPSAFLTACSWSPAELVRDWLHRRVLELVYSAWDLEDFARDLGWVGPPFRWDPDRRFQLRAEVDAAFFHLYLGPPTDWRAIGSRELLDAFPTPRDAAEHILDTFPVVRRSDEKAHGGFRTKRVILEIYDAMTDAIASGRPYQSLLNPPAADDSVAHPPRPGVGPGRWIPVDEPPRSA